LTFDTGINRRNVKLKGLSPAIAHGDRVDEYTP
jgi:hypothetical protein